MLLCSTPVAGEDTGVVKRVADATVLIRANLKHGFAEDRKQQDVGLDLVF